MHIKTKDDEGLIILSGTNEEEEAILRALSLKEPGFILKYDGRSGAEANSPLTERILLHFSLGGQKVTIQATNNEDENHVRSMRNAIYFGSAGLNVRSHHKDGTKIHLNVCVNFCKHCKAPLVGMLESEWRVCEACVALCEHTYKQGPVHGGKAGVMSHGTFCNKCGRGDNSKLLIPIIGFGETAVVAI
jgi:hypothetical protein